MNVFLKEVIKIADIFAGGSFGLFLSNIDIQKAAQDLGVYMIK